MNTKEVVKLTASTDYVPVKYFVMESIVGPAAASTYLWLKVISYGIDTKEHYDNYITSLNADAPDKSNFQGTLNEYSVVALSEVSSYTSPKSNHMLHPVG